MKPDNIVLEGVTLRNVLRSENTQTVSIPFSDFMWFVGFFEGEGSIVYNVARKNLSISVVSTDFENVANCKEMIRWGNIQGPYKKEGKKDWWYWSIGSGPAVIKLVEKMYKYLSPRRQSQIITSINKYHSRTDLRHRVRSICKRGHILDKSNLLINHNSGRTCLFCFNEWRKVYNEKRRRIYASQH